MTTRRIQWSVVWGTVLAASATPAAGFLLFDGNPKWGDPALGTGAVVTWSLIPDGTEVLRRPPVFPPDEPFIFHDFWTGTSNLGSVFAQLDPDPAVGEALFMTAVNNAFATWAAAADLSFVQVPDAGLPLGFPAGVPTEFPTPAGVGDIRIGAWDLELPFDNFAAHAFEPPGMTTNAGMFFTMHSPSTFGDITLNANAFFSVFPGLGEGDVTGGFPNDLEGLLLHEIGHSLGLQHPEEDGLDPGEANAIMFVGPGCCNDIQRTLAADDIAAIQFLYGPAPAQVLAPSSFALAGAGLAVLGAAGWRRRTNPGLSCLRH